MSPRRYLALAISFLTLAAVGVQLSEAEASGAEAVEIVVTLVDPDLYLEQSKKVYFKTEKCLHQSSEERVVLVIDKNKDQVWLVFADGDTCRVLNASQDRGSL